MKLGVVGLPNVGKSTLFNAITQAGAESANYPFCTIEPNVGIVDVPDERLNVLTKLYESFFYFFVFLFLIRPKIDDIIATDSYIIPPIDTENTL